ncbi:hypothetical protein STEG23_035864, partial [Scotinomys teguina]
MYMWKPEDNFQKVRSLLLPVFLQKHLEFVWTRNGTADKVDFKGLKAQKIECKRLRD